MRLETVSKFYEIIIIKNNPAKIRVNPNAAEINPEYVVLISDILLS